METRPALAQTLLELTKSARVSVNSAFEEFLDQNINISAGIRSRASDSQIHLREFLASEHERDSSFPLILSENDSDFIGGSFGRHSKIWPLDDIDIYFPLDGAGLYYVNQFGFLMPYQVLSDVNGPWNPLLSSKWMNGNFLSSSKLTQGVVTALRRHYPSSDIRADGHAVNVRFTHGETDEEDGLGFDVVLCFSLRSNAGTGEQFYVIPDGADGWLRTNPRLDAEVSERLQANNNRTFRKAVKLLKYWNRERLGGRILSYYLELAMMKTFLSHNSRSVFITTIPEAVTVGFYALSSALAAGSLRSWVNEAPDVKPGQNIDMRILMLAQQAYDRASQALTMGKTDPEEALKIWALIFGQSFGG